MIGGHCHHLTLFTDHHLPAMPSSDCEENTAYTIAAESHAAFASSIRQFASPKRAKSSKNYFVSVGTPPSPLDTPPRTPRKRRVYNDDDDEFFELVVDDGSPQRKKTKKPARPYASPEVYAHLEPLPDSIKDGLDSK